jgi:valyl-tRNA synthetase
VWSWWRDGSIQRADWPTEAGIHAELGGSPDAAALTALAGASKVTAAIRRERSLRKLAFGVPVQALRLPEDIRGDWPHVADDVLAGNNATAAEVTFATDFAVEFAVPAAT